ncbi:hypothetical protein RD792_000357 [Penstemon davidsonii]|uniref:Uncharacterized protein n=1 Tax=Penstemon davidsonii TaxID=160366 RepID=A0ABR0DKF8_9LAMI|nr:hypothetical protein RD792_000357 [Penstemon davidsonii]
MESIVSNHSKKLEDDIKELGQKIKHHEDNIKYLKTLKNKLDDSILDMQVSLGKHHTSSSTSINEDTEDDTIQHILKYENSAAALLCRTRSKPEELQVSDNPFTEDVLGIVATLGKVDDDNLSRLLSKYLGVETMLALVCKTYEGYKALEAFNKDRPLDDRSLVICLENLRPYTGEFLADDPQQRLGILKPKSINGEIPSGFLGFAVNMVFIDYTKLYGVSKSGYNLRETLFYNLFSTLQVYRSRKDMINALPWISNGAVSLDGGMIRSPGVFSLGHHLGDIDVKFPCGPKNLNLHESYYEIENQMKETKWKKGRAFEDMQTEQALLDRARYNYETKKQEFVAYIAQSSFQATETPTVGQNSGRPIGTKKVKKGKVKASTSSDVENQFVEILRRMSETQLILKVGRERRHAEMLELQARDEEHRILAMNCSSFTPDTKLYWKNKRQEIMQKKLPTNLSGGLSNPGDDDFDPRN